MPTPRPFRLVVHSGLLALVTGCGEGAGPTRVPASVVVTSPIDTILALGRTVQLAAVAQHQSGNPIPGAQFTWTTSSIAIAPVTATGLVTAQGSGFATITAVTSGSASGNIRLRVVPADLQTVSTLASDPFASALVAKLSIATRSSVQAALAGCAAGADTGNIVAVKRCTDMVGSAAASVTDPTDRALLAVLALYADHIEGLLGL